MNNKGFTLVELLATIVILGLIMGIASVGVTSAIRSSKLRSEGIFVEKVGRLIDDYVGLYGSSLEIKRTFWLSKCDDCDEMVQVYELESISLRDLVDKKLVDESSMVNPGNKKRCLDGTNGPEVRIFKDEDYVSYYYVDLSGDATSCDISEENGTLNTLPTGWLEEVMR